MRYNSTMDTGHAPKNDITPHIIRDFFTEEELADLLHCVERQKTDEALADFYKPLILPNMARMQVELMFPPHIQEKVERFASEVVGEEVFMSHNSYLSYNKVHNPEANPKLPPHYDSDNYFSKLTLDYQLDSNIDWPVVIEGEKFHLNYGDLLIFWGAGTIHWRDPIKFKDGDNTEVLTMHFSTREDYEKLNIPARDPEAREARLAKWNADPRFKQFQLEFQEKEESFKTTGE